MTETRFTWQWLFVVAGIGLLVGAAFGLIFGWIVLPVAGSAVDVSALNAGAQNDYIVLVANTFAYDDDLPRAKERLTLLKDPNITVRVENLAKALNTRQDPSAANLAELAIELGSTDSSLQVLASSVVKIAGGSPTKYAQLNVAPTEAPQPTAAATDTSAPTVTATEQPTPSATKLAQAVAAKNTPRPAATSQPQAASAPPPEFQPALSQWWDSQYIPANASAGQQYWRLKFARYCDWSPDEAHNTCPGMPGGIMDHTIYVMVLDASGGCASNPTVKVQINDGTVDEYGSDKAKTISYAWYSSPCMTDWEKEMYGEGNTVSIEGFPSDTLTNLVLCSKNHPVGVEPPPCGHAHVHYFLVFQQTTR
jgi:hypothetical protein